MFNYYRCLRCYKKSKHLVVVCMMKKDEVAQEKSPISIPATESNTSTGWGLLSHYNQQIPDKLWETYGRCCPVVSHSIHHQKEIALMDAGVLLAPWSAVVVIHVNKSLLQCVCTVEVLITQSNTTWINTVNCCTVKTKVKKGEES